MTASEVEVEERAIVVRVNTRGGKGERGRMPSKDGVANGLKAYRITLNPFSLIRFTVFVQLYYYRGDINYFLFM